MAEVDKKVSKLQGITDSGERSTILYLLYARVASGLENKEADSDSIPGSIGEVWKEAAGHIDKLAEQNPGKAFKLALTLSLLPRSNDPKKEMVYRWMRGDGPVLLAKKSLREPFLQFLNSDQKAPGFLEKMQEYMAFDMSKIQSNKDAFHDPNCFLAIATMFLGTKVEGDELTKTLTDAAKERLNDPNVSRVVKYYAQYEDTAWIVQELEPFLAKT